MYSTFLGSLTIIPGGSVGTEISYVPRWEQAVKKSRRIWRGWRNVKPLPKRGRVDGGRLVIFLLVFA